MDTGIEKISTSHRICFVTVEQRLGVRGAGGDISQFVYFCNPISH